MRDSGISHNTLYGNIVYTCNAPRSEVAVETVERLFSRRNGTDRTGRFADRRYRSAVERA